MKSGDTFGAVVLTGIVILAAWLFVIVASEPRAEWQVPGGEQICEATVSDDGTMMLLTGDPMGGSSHMLFSLTGSGVEKWAVDIPGLSGVPYGTNFIRGRILAVDDGVTYLFVSGVVSSENPVYTHEYSALYAISAVGKVLWQMPFDQSGDLSMVSLHVIHGRLYLYDGCNEYVLSRSGEQIWSTKYTEAQPAISPDGYVYNAISLYTSNSATDTLVTAYYPNGTVFWKTEVDGYFLNIYCIDPVEYSLRGVQLQGLYTPEQLLPLYYDQRLYLTLSDRVTALDTNGTVLWSVPLDNPYGNKLYLPFWPAPFDSAGNLYVKLCNTSYRPAPDLFIISPEGNVSIRAYDYTRTYLAASDGLVYSILCSDTTQSLEGPLSGQAEGGSTPQGIWWGGGIAQRANRLETLSPETITLAEMATGRQIWSFTPPIGDVKSVTLNASNVGRYFGPVEASSVRWANIDNTLPGKEGYEYLDKTVPVNISKTYIQVMPSGDLTYVSLYCYNTQYPATFDRTKVYYFSALYALDNSGGLLWTKQTDYGADLLAANNSTIFYSTRDGRVHSATLFLASGITIAAILCVMFKFFSAGVVSRARGRLEQNENRKAVMQFVAGHPGSTQREIARGTAMNLGTIRYHMLILSLNHKVVSFQSDGKHVRYFQNSNTYCREEQLVISLVKRDNLRELLATIAEQPGMSNRELAHALGMQESAVSRYMKELTDRGIVDRLEAPGSSLTYSINGRLAASVDRAIKREKS
ncbi:winged helix-turn-helix transcriptional regulator [Methanocella sp. MCL-LM]|uniref:winged helix-turn-helix transcriptional regulator n=1 Tax=Methanocella sp. MCL-LM TaxID=3412035 RepID=UPI003C752EBE